MRPGLQGVKRQVSEVTFELLENMLRTLFKENISERSNLCCLVFYCVLDTIIILRTHI